MSSDPTKTGVKYIGNDEPFVEQRYGSGLKFMPGQTRLVDHEIAAKLTRHAEFVDDESFDYVTSTKTLTGGSDFLSEVSTLKLPAGVTDLTAGFGGGGGGQVVGISANDFGAVANATSRSIVGAGTDSSAAFILAANAAVAAKRGFVTANPGCYHCPGLNSDQMNGLYIYGDGIVFTKESHVLAVTTAQSAEGVAKRGQRPNGLHGTLAINFDDAFPAQWEFLPPIFKRLGIVGSISWPVTSAASAKPWLKELARHGWEIQAHGTNHENFATTYTTRAPLHAAATVMKSELADVMGSTDNLQFVYPQHQRTAFNDDVLEQYFASGRGVASETFVNNGQQSTWLRSAVASDAWYETDAGLLLGKEFLFDLAKSNGRVVLYLHTPASFERLKALLAYALDLGINIVQARHVFSAGLSFVDRYMQDQSRWTLSAGTDFDASEKLDGPASLRFDIAGGGSSNAMYRKRKIATSQAFSVLKVTVPYKSLAALTVADERYGLAIRVTGWRTSEQGVELSGAQTEMSFPGNSWPIANYDAPIIQYIFVPASVSAIQFGLAQTNVLANTVYFSGVRIQKIDEIQSVSFPATLAASANGTGYIWHGVFGLANIIGSTLAIQLTPRFAANGKLSITVSGGLMKIVSSDTTDAGQIDVTISLGRKAFVS